MIRDMLSYRGREGYWTWILHRATGVAILLFLLVHIIDTMLVFWPSAYDQVVALYRNPVIHVTEILLVAIVAFHAVNGVRIILVDFWAEATQRRRELLYAMLALFAILFIPAAAVMAMAIARHLSGGG